MASKYYAVKKGKVPGIYLNWNDCKAMVDALRLLKRQKNLLPERKFLPERKVLPV